MVDLAVWLASFLFLIALAVFFLFTLVIALVGLADRRAARRPPPPRREAVKQLSEQEKVTLDWLKAGGFLLVGFSVLVYLDEGPASILAWGPIVAIVYGVVFWWRVSNVIRKDGLKR